MATGSDHHDAVDTKHSAQPVASPRSELVNNFIAYYSSTDCASVPADAFSSHDLLSAAPLSSSSTPISTSSSSSTATSLMNMRPAKKLPVRSSGQSTDSEQTGNGSSESSSSLGDSAAAAARVLAAWQDRPQSSVSTTIEATVSAGISPASLADSSAIWTAARASAARVQSSTSTPRQAASSFDLHAREGSAPVTGSLEASNRRPDMGFLALLNSAAAYVAESSVSTQHQQHHAADHPYLTHGDMLSDGTLTLSSINNGFIQGNVDASAEQGDYSAHYSATLSSAAYQDLAQALQHIAATSSGTGDGGIMSTAAMESRAHGSYVPHEYASANAHMGTRSASGIRPAQLMPGDSLVAMKPELSTIPRQSTSSASKRKRKEPSAASESMHTPTKRRASHASEHPCGAASTPPIPPQSADARRTARKWSEEETTNLLQGCTKYGVGAWKKILDDPAFTFNNRTSVDLKDRFRTIRAQECAHSPRSKSANKKNNGGKEPDVVWPLPPNSQRLQGLQRVQRKPTRNYSADEDRRLLIGVMRHANHWTKIAADPDLKLDDRPGQSLRDRLRNAFPEVFELFGYVIPKKERVDREPCGDGTHVEPDTDRATVGPQRRKAPTASKRMDGTIPEHIKDKILAVLADMNASLDPHPIIEPEDEGVDSCYDADADGDPSVMDVDSVSPGTSRAGKSGGRSGATARATVGKAGRGSRRRSTVSGELAVSSGTAALAGDPQAASSSRDAGRNNKRLLNKRSRSRSKTMASIDAHHLELSSAAASGGALIGFKLNPASNTAAFSLPMTNDGGIHSAPTHTDNPGCGPMADLSAFSDCDHRRTGTLSAGAFGSGNSGHRNFLLDSFAPSVFTRPMGTMTPTDQLDALALEGRFGSGYSTPTHSAKRRHSVQVDINDAMAAAVAAGMDRPGFSSSLHYFHPSVAGLDHHHRQHHSAGASGSGSLQMNAAADTIRRMTVGGPIDADAFLFPRIPEDDTAAVAAAAAAAAAVGMSAQMSASQTVSSTPASDSMHVPGGASSAATVTNIGVSGMSAGDMYKFPEVTAAESSALATTASNDARGDAAAGYRGQLRSAQRLLRANGVADDNSIGLSTTSSGESRVDLEALAQFSQWFPQFAPASMGWGMGDSGGESIDPNMLDAGLDSAMAAAVAAHGGNNGGGHGGEANMTHARRRSHFDWYGLTPSIAAALEAASTSAAVAAQAAAASDDSAMSTLGSFGLGQGSLNPSYRRPSMPIFPTFGFTPSDMLGMTGNADVGADPMAGAVGNNAESGLYGVAASQQDSNAGMVATAAADAVAVALGERSSGGPIRARATEVPGRRRTMHVPPLLLEGVATAEFGNPGADSYVAQPLGIGAQLPPHGRHGSAPYRPRRPTSQTASTSAAAATAAMTRGRRSRTISSNSNGQQVMARLGTTASAMPSAARPPLPPVSEAPTVPASHGTQLQFPLLPSSLGTAAPGGRHTRSLSGTQLTQDAMSALAGVPIDVDIDAMTTLSAGDYATSFKASLWPFGDDVHLEDCVGMQDETRSLIDMRGRDAPALVDLYRPASSTPTGHRCLSSAATAQASSGGSARNHSPVLLPQSGTVASPVAPRSAASTPGRREAVGM